MSGTNLLLPARKAIANVKTTSARIVTISPRMTDSRATSTANSKATTRIDKKVTTGGSRLSSV